MWVRLEAARRVCETYIYTVINSVIPGTVIYSTRKHFVVPLLHCFIGTICRLGLRLWPRLAGPLSPSPKQQHRKTPEQVAWGQNIPLSPEIYIHLVFVLTPKIPYISGQSGRENSTVPAGCSAHLSIARFVWYLVPVPDERTSWGPNKATPFLRPGEARSVTF